MRVRRCSNLAGVKKRALRPCSRSSRHPHLTARRICCWRRQGNSVLNIRAIALGVLLLVLGASQALAQGGRYVWIVQGAAGEEQYAVQHKKWVDALTTLLRDKYKYDAAHLIVLTEQ